MDTTDPNGATEPDELSHMIAAVQRRFVVHGARPLFVTAATGLWRIFLENLPPQVQAYHHCNTCRHFFERFGALVTIDGAGRLSSALWPDDAPPLFRRASALTAQAATSAAIERVMIPATAALGTLSSSPRPDGMRWRHFAVRVQQAHSHPLWTAHQVEAERKDDWRLLTRGLAEFPQPLVERAHALLSSGTLYRAERCLGVATWLLALHQELASVTSPQQREALVWRAVATAPAGHARVRGSVVGALLADLARGRDADTIKQHFEEKMAPSRYLRPHVAPTAGNIVRAEKAIAALQATGSLARRYARLADLQRFVWGPRASPPARPPARTKGSPGGVFEHLKKKASPESDKLALPRQTLTWEKFARTVLPDAIAIAAQVPACSDRFMALVTAEHPDAPPILQWDTEERRNPVSWYYRAGIDAEIKRRVDGAGGQYEEVDLRVSLRWNNRNDLDLHVITPRGEHIYFGDRRSSCGGWLDVDMNAHGETTAPVETIRWGLGAAQRGRYRIYVQNYGFYERLQSSTLFKVEVEVSGEIYHFDGLVSPQGETGDASDVPVLELEYKPGRSLTRPPRNAAPPPDPNRWNVIPGEWAAVTAVVDSPNLWGERPQTQHGRHTFFLLHGCRDTKDRLGHGFFAETVRSELHSVRATLEAYNRSAKISGADAAEACGLGMTDQKPWGLHLRVTTANAVATYLIDRRD
jgi:hypothetical protein